MLVGAPAAHCELDRVSLADHDQPRGDQAPCKRGSTARLPIPPHQRPACRHFSLNLYQVLERDRDPVQRPDRMPRADRLVGRLCREPRVLGINLDKGVQLGVRRADPFEQAIDQIDRREAAGADLGRENMYRQEGGITGGRAHGSSLGSCHATIRPLMSALSIGRGSTQRRLRPMVLHVGRPHGVGRRSSDARMGRVSRRRRCGPRHRAIVRVNARSLVAWARRRFLG